MNSSIIKYGFKIDEKTVFSLSQNPSSCCDILLYFILDVSKDMRQKIIERELSLVNPHLEDHRIVRTKLGKPYIQGAYPFSVAHSRNTSLLSIMLDHKSSVGVDIEEYQTVPLKPYQPYFHHNELQFITHLNDSSSALLQIWTKKEAVLKASGVGLHEQINLIDTTKNELTLNNQHYGLTGLELRSGYLSAISWRKNGCGQKND